MSFVPSNPTSRGVLFARRLSGKTSPSRSNAMATRKEFDEAMRLYDEAMAVYEAAKAEFEALEQKIKERHATGKELTGAEVLEEERVRASLFFAQVRLSRRRPPVES